jgi:heme oxygenase
MPLINREILGMFHKFETNPAACAEFEAPLCLSTRCGEGVNTLGKYCIEGSEFGHGILLMKHVLKVGRKPAFLPPQNI